MRKAVISLIYFIPFLLFTFSTPCVGVRELHTDSIDTPSEVAVINNNFRELSNGKLNKRNPGIPTQLTISGASRFRATRNTNQAAANNVYTTIIYATEDYDNLSEHNTTTGEFTATEAGTYFIHAGVISVSVAWDAGEVWQISIFINGTQKNIGSIDIKAAAITTNAKSDVTDILTLAANDVVTARIYHNQGASVDISGSALYNFFAIHRIS